MDRADPGTALRQLGVEARQGGGVVRASEPEDPGQLLTFVGDAGYGVDLASVDQLHPVLDRAQEPVGLVEGGGVSGVDVAGGAQLGQGFQGGGRAQGRVGSAVHQLQQLHRELDVADAARSSLQLPSGHAAARHLGFGPGLHGPQRAEVVGRQRPAPQGFGGGGGEGGGQLGRPGHRPGLEQRLELPGRGPSLPVRLEGGHRAHEGPIAAFGPKVGVDPEAAAGDAHGLAHRRLVAGTGAALAVAGEDDVDVAGVVELASSQLAHPHHHDVGRAGQGAAGGQHVVGQGRQGGGGDGEAVGAGQVSGGDAEVFVRLPPAQALLVQVAPLGGRGPSGERAEDF